MCVHNIMLTFSKERERERERGREREEEEVRDTDVKREIKEEIREHYILRVLTRTNENRTMRYYL